MKTKRLVLPAICCIPLLSSCATNQTAGNEAWSVKPDVSVRHSAENPQAWYELGRYYQGQNRYEQAVSAYQKALAANSRFVEARNGLAVVYSMQGRLDDAIAEFKIAVGQAPTAAHMHNNLGYAYYLKGLYAEAVASLEQATVLDPTSQSAYNNLAAAQAKAGDTEKSRRALAQAADVQIAKSAQSAGSPQPESSAAVKAASPDTAGGLQVVVAPATPDEPSARPLAGSVVKQTGNPVQAVESRIRMIQAAPSVYEMRAPIEPAQVVATAPAEVRPVDAIVVNPSGNPVQELKGRIRMIQAAPSAYELRVPIEPAQVVATAPVEVRPTDASVVNPSGNPVQELKDRIRIIQAAPSAYELRVPAEPAQVFATVPVEVNKKFRVEVSNGNGVRGMARKVGRFLHQKGLSVTRLTNQKTFRVTASQIHYRSGYEAEALRIKANLRHEAVLVQREDLRADVHVRLVLGKDMAADTAHYRNNGSKIKLAAVTFEID